MAPVLEKETTRSSLENKKNMRSHIAVKVWSESLQAHLWIVADKDDIVAFRFQGITGSIYTTDEIRELKGIDNNLLEIVHMLLFD
jgi:hypothetical protein